MPQAESKLGSHAVAGAALLALGIALGFPLASPAAESPDAPAAAPEAAPTPPVLPYSLNEAAVQSSNMLARIQSRLSKIGALPDSPPVATGLAGFEQEVQRGRVELEEVLARDYSRNEVEDRRAYWDRLDEDLAGPQRELDASIVSAEEFLAELRAADARWEATRAELAIAEVPASVRESADTTLAAIRKARSSVEKHRNRLLARQAHVVALRSTAAAMLLDLDEAEAKMFRRSFERNRAPLWRSIRDLEQTPVVSARQRLTEGGIAVTLYLRHHTVALGVQGLALLTLIWIGWKARRAALRRDADLPTARLPLALRHVIATGILLSVAPSAWMYSSAPLELKRIFALLVLPAWVLLLRSFLPASLHPTVAGLALIVLFETLREVMGTVFAARQIVLVLELGLAAFGVFWLRRPARIATAAPLLGAGGWVRVLDGWLRLGALLLPVGAIAAGAGFVMFAEAILRFYLGGSYLGGVLMLAAELARELTRAWLESGALDFLYMVRRNRERVLAVLRRVYRVAATVTWLWIGLRNQGGSGAAIDALQEALAWQLGYGGVHVSVGGIVAFVVTLWIGWLAGRFVFFVLDQEVFARVVLPRGVPYALATLSQYAVTTIAFLLALSALGVELQNISILMGALGVGIGFGLQNAVSNFISGLMLLFERPVHVGDRLQIENLTGVVSRIGIRASRLRTIEGADVIVPNSELISNRVTNWTLADRMRMVSIPVGVSYGSDLRLALQVLREAAKANPDVLQNPAPDAVFIGFGESSVDFEVRVFADADSFVAVRTSLGLSIAEALAAAGIEIPFPQRDLHLRSVKESILAARTAGAPESDSEPEAGA